MKPKSKKENRGGARPGSGAKKLDDPKVQVNLWVNKSKVDNMGGTTRVQEVCYALINSLQAEVITQPVQEAFADPEFPSENIHSNSGTSL